MLTIRYHYQISQIKHTGVNITGIREVSNNIPYSCTTIDMYGTLFFLVYLKRPICFCYALYHVKKTLFR